MCVRIYSVARVSICMCVERDMYVCVERDRERECVCKPRSVTCTFVCTHILSGMFASLCVERERNVCV